MLVNQTQGVWSGERLQRTSVTEAYRNPRSRGTPAWSTWTNNKFMKKVWKLRKFDQPRSIHWISMQSLACSACLSSLLQEFRFRSTIAFHSAFHKCHCFTVPLRPYSFHHSNTVQLIPAIQLHTGLSQWMPFKARSYIIWRPLTGAYERGSLPHWASPINRSHTVSITPTTTPTTKTFPIRGLQNLYWRTLSEVHLPEPKALKFN